MTTQKHNADKNYFMNTKETIYGMKMINDLYHKIVNPVTRQIKLYPRFAGRRASSSFALHEGLMEELAEEL